MELTETVSGLNPASYYPIIAIVTALGIVITAAYILRAIGNVFFGNYNEHKWHDMRPLLGIDKLTLLVFVGILVAIGLFPSIIAPIIESGVSPVVARLQEAQDAQAANILNSMQLAASDLIRWLGGA